ncbi:MAG: HD domain-containing protein, partial [Thiovulaceae bacterium]|nr:HD domain-containing protein [Sulfurimonadaceae bacterium]
EEQSCKHIVGLGPYKDYDNTDYSCKTNEALQKRILQAVKDKKDYSDHETLIIFQRSRTHYEGFVLYINILKNFDDISRQLIKIFLEKATIAYENAMLQAEMDETQKDVIFTLSEIAEQRSYETGKHVKRVAKYCELLAQEYGLSQEEIDTLYASSPMHDIGKIAIADNILQKPGGLNESEFEVMKTHTTIGHDMLKSSTKGVFKMSALISLQHHEKWDGSGYPNGLKGEEIHIFARITTLSDVYDALGSKRIYKEAWDHENILQFIKDERGKHFDPDLVDIFFKNIDKFIVIKERYKDSE